MNEFTSNIREINYSCRTLESDTISELWEYSSLTSLDLSMTNIRDEQLRFLVNLPLLEVLILSKTKVTSWFTRWLKNLVNLETLVIESTLVDDSAIPDIARLPKLKFLNIARTNVKSLTGLEKARQLRRLDLRGNAVGDFSIEVILDLAKLTYVDVYETEFSSKGIEWLRKKSKAEIAVD